ncbi:hypothetical protein BJY04DRAFT_219697 [Aspergillus karnatakaensis]|uniref:uncharacterized protein n=1 Tax=Aspergillus karnatakaensis TaxID=1810916 RepID=UPI003CCC9858
MDSQTPASRRVSLACVPCRSKHLRCDATTPICGRCTVEGLECVYLKSRRGGRRTKGSGIKYSTENSLQHQPQAQLPLPPVLDDPPFIPPPREDSAEDSRSTSEPAMSIATSDTLSDSSLSEQFFNQYYSFFHSAHPCVLPLWALKQRIAADARPLQAIIAVVQYIGSVYAKSTLLPSMKADAEQAVAALGATGPITGFDVQAVLLLSIATYWQNEPDKALRFLDQTIAMALNLGMQKQEFAYANGGNDPVLEECWRRTWWQIYMTDAHIAGSTSTFPFRTSGVEMTADLPCDAAEYDSGQIPRPRTLQEYDMREFLDDDERNFSSFAEMVGLTRGLDIALTARQGMTIVSAPGISANTDATVTAWRSLLHPSKKNIVREDGTVDELLFKANMIIQTYVVELHRQLSTLAYSPIEAIAHCSPAPPPESLRGCNSTESQLHTAKVLRAIDQFDDLLTLPTNIATHTPFIICMISNLVIAHLSACRFHYSGQALKLARERIRLSMGALKVLGEFWPMGARTYKEVGIVAREILGLKEQGRSPSSVSVQSKTPAQGQSQSQSQSQLKGLHISTREIQIQPQAAQLQAMSVPEMCFSPAAGVGGEMVGSDMPDMSAFLQQPSLEDMELLNTNFDFCGLFDMNMAYMAVA